VTLGITVKTANIQTSLIPPAPAAGQLHTGIIESAVCGMLRTVAQEAPTLGVSAEHESPYDTKALLQTQLLSTARSTVRLFDGYGDSSAASVHFVPRLMATASAVPTPQPFQLLAKPRGALSNLVAAKVDVRTHVANTLVVQVRAVGLNFRLVRVLLVAHWGGYCRVVTWVWRLSATPMNG